MLDANNIKKYFQFANNSVLINQTNPNTENPDLNTNTPKRVFVDNTASTQLALPALEKLVSSAFSYANIHRGEYGASQQTTEEFERAYNISANLINAKSFREIILGRNTTEMINLVMNCTMDYFRDGDNIVTTFLEHNSNYVPWLALQKKLKKRGINIKINLVEFDRETGELNMDQFAEFVNEKTKLVAVTGASNFMGIKPDLKAISEIAHASRYNQPDGLSGSYFLVDGAQLVPNSFVDVQEIGCDFLAWSFHKMGLPLGIGGLYAKQEIIQNPDVFDPFMFGGDMVEDVKRGQAKFKDAPWRYTAGTPNILGTIATGNGLIFMINLALEYLQQKPEDKDENIICKQIETEILMNTRRGDFNLNFKVPEKYHEVFRKHLAQNNVVERILRNPELRMEEVTRRVRKAMYNIQNHEQSITQYAIDSLSEIPGVSLYGTRDASQRTGLIAFNIRRMNPQAVAVELSKRGIEARNGNHCASISHEYMGIEGSVRFSFYVYNDVNDAERAVNAVREILGTI